MLKIYRLEWFYGVQGLIIENSQNPYVFINRVGQNYKIMSLNSSFFANFSILSITKESVDNTRNNHRVAKFNDTIYFCSTFNVTFDTNTFLYQSYVTPLDESLNPLTWAQNTINSYNEPYYYEIPIGKGVDTGFDYSVIDTPINIAYYKSSSNLESVNVLVNTTVINLTECLWPRFDLAYNKWAFPLPEFILNGSYVMKIGKFSLNLFLNKIVLLIYNKDLLINYMI